VALYRYPGHQRTLSPPILLVMSLVSALRPRPAPRAAIGAPGFDVYMLVRGVPDDEGEQLQTYCDQYIRRLRRASAPAASTRSMCSGIASGVTHAVSSPPVTPRSAAHAQPVGDAIDFTGDGRMTALLRDGRLTHPT
jgi:hypothetical protein